RLSHLVGESLPAAVRGAGHAAHPHRRRPARRPRLLRLNRSLILELQENPMTNRTTVHGLEVDSALKRFIDEQVLPGTGVAVDGFWSGFDAIVRELAPKNAALLAERDRLKAELDTWHQANPGPIRDMAAYRGFLEGIGYLVPAPQGAQATTANVDDELAR